ncbi:MAG: ATP-binding cassette domain-containing protein [Deltaproteobacteria bacterium]|nr:ATP-binding cassette domain-containing protein [Deltaproteobacteria bacterium]
MFNPAVQDRPRERALNSPEPALIEASFGVNYGSFAFKATFELLEPGITVVFGPSGAGKTTLLRLLAGLARPDWGFIRHRGRTLFDSEKKLFLPPEKRNLAYVFQEARLFSHFSAQNNLLFATRFGGRPPVSASFLARTVNLLGLSNLLSRRTQTLSGGEAQRVAIGRALLAQGQLLLMDEPLASLDRARKKELLGYIAQIPPRFLIPILYVTHAEDELDFLADQVLTVREGQCQLRTRDEFLGSTKSTKEARNLLNGAQ